MKQALCIETPERISDGVQPFPLDFWRLPVSLQDRATCETDERYLQLIPYVLVRNPAGEFFTYFRGEGGGEARLHGKLSIGAGGHMDGLPPAPGYLYSHVQIEASRELREELGIAVVPIDIQMVGLLNERSTSVGRVHCGILCSYTLHGNETLTLEEGQVEKGRFMSLGDLSRHPDYDRLEPWSRVAVDYLCSGGA